MVLDLALLGTGGMMPLPNRALSSVLLRYKSHLIMFDCGEGTQVGLRALGWGVKDVDLILISHVHGDHILGIPGLLLTLGNAGRTEPLLIVGPPGTTNILRGLLVVSPYLPFEVRCHEVTADDEAPIDLDGLQVRSAEGVHHVPCIAYRLEVARARRFLPEKAKQLNIPLEHWSTLQRGESVDGIHPEQVLGPPRRGVSVGLVTDTRPTPALTELVKDVDVLVCEGTYGSDDDQQRAVERKHMTFREAATLAQQANARQLLLTHFSPALVDPPAHSENAQAVFANTIVGHDGLTLTLRFAD
jgi:ribonuclease Z